MDVFTDMRGSDGKPQSGMFSYISLEERIREDHPLRAVRKLADEVLKSMSGKLDELYSDVGRPSIAPERLFRALLLQAFYSIRSERLLMEQLDYSMLSAGLSGWRSTTKYGATRCSARIATGC